MNDAQRCDLDPIQGQGHGRLKVSILAISKVYLRLH